MAAQRLMSPDLREKPRYRLALLVSVQIRGVLEMVLSIVQNSGFNFNSKGVLAQWSDRTVFPMRVNVSGTL